MQPTYFCVLCNKRNGFTTKAKLRKHSVLAHRYHQVGDVIAGRPYEMHAFKCNVCRVSFKFTKEWRNHLHMKHKWDPETVELEFSNLLEFDKWKRNMEASTYTKYKQQCGNKNGVNYYNCYSRATGVCFSERLKDFERTYKTHAICTSQIVVRKKDGIRVVFHGRHYGHPPVPVEEIEQFCEVSEPVSNYYPSTTPNIPTTKIIKTDAVDNDESSKSLSANVVGLFKKRIKETSEDLENEICRLQGKEMTSDAVECLKSAWKLIKEAKIKLIEANSKCLMTEELDSLSTTEDLASLSESDGIVEENETVGTASPIKFGSISIVDGSLHLRCYDSKYKNGFS